MLTSLALIFLAGLAMAALCSLLRLPRIIGMLFTGILLGPYVLGLLDPSILAISADLRQMALIIILIKAGLSLDLGDLRRVGRPAVLMSFLSASFEILAYILFAPMLLGITRLEAAVMGAVLGTVSPAVVVPRMVRLMEEGRVPGKAFPSSFSPEPPAMMSLSSSSFPPSPAWPRAAVSIWRSSWAFRCPSVPESCWVWLWAGSSAGSSTWPGTGDCRCGAA